MSRIFESVENFEDFLNLDKIFPHSLSFLKEKEKDKKYSFMYATLYCLTNQKLFMHHILNLSKTNTAKNLKDYEFFLMVESIKKDIDISNQKSSDFNGSDETLEFIKTFKFSLGNEINEPRILMRYIFIDILTSLNNNSSNNSEIPSSGILASNKNNFSSNFSLKNSLKRSFDWSNNLNLDNEYNIIIKTTGIQQNIKYRYSSYLKFYLKENKTNTLIDCLNEYLKYSRDDNLYTNKSNKSLFYKNNIYIKLPQTLIILIYFGKNKEEPHNYLYNFDEILDLKNVEFVDQNIKYKKYFLSAMIVCKFPEQENKYFYTFFRRDINSLFRIYNSKDNQINDIKDTKKELEHLKQEKQCERKNIKSYPYVLIYTAF